MDLLATFHLEELPEQQTRMMDLMERHEEDFTLSLGFDACCTCGTALEKDGVSVVPCPGCNRVKYCSEPCRQQDAQVLARESGGEDDDQRETAMGHSSIVCALLRVCNDDEAVENDGIGDSSDSSSQKQSSGKLDPQRWQAAAGRIQSEYESYPATLANVIAEGPCFQEVLKRKGGDGSSLVIHVIGASEDSEGWGDRPLLRQKARNQEVNVWEAYAEALSQLSESQRLASIELVMIGPECPKEDVRLTKAMQLSASTPGSSRKADGSQVVGELIVKTVRGLYDGTLLDQHGISKPDIVVFFQPGFTVPEYENWRETLACIDGGTPFLLATNTELEGIADCQYLLDQDKIRSIPPGLAEMFGLYSSPDDDERGDEKIGESFFSENPFCGMRVRQSGTMANDLYVKNRWMLGGIIDSFDPSKANQSSTSSKRRRTAMSDDHSGAEGNEMNTKQKNPALI